MPHSVDPASDLAMEANVKMEEIESEALTSVNTPGHESNIPTDAGDQDIDMAESSTKGPVPVVGKDVKLEELFADVDSDDEFPSSHEPDPGHLPSSPEAHSPMQVDILPRINLLMRSSGCTKRLC